MAPCPFLFYCLLPIVNMLTISKQQRPSQPMLTNAIQNPANCPISTTGQNTEVWSIMEKVQPGKKKGQNGLVTRLRLTLIHVESESPLFPRSRLRPQFLLRSKGSLNVLRPEVTMQCLEHGAKAKGPILVQGESDSTFNTNGKWFSRNSLLVMPRSPEFVHFGINTNSPQCFHSSRALPPTLS